MPHSTRFRIHQVLFGLMQQVATAEQAAAIYNPALPVGITDKGPRVLFLLDRGDALVEQPGQREKRRARVVLGAYARTSVPDVDADLLHFAARIALRDVRPLLSAADITAPICRESQVEPELKETQTDGGLLLSAFEIEYLEHYPAT